MSNQNFLIIILERNFVIFRLALELPHKTDVCSIPNLVMNFFSFRLWKMCITSCISQKGDKNKGLYVDNFLIQNIIPFLISPFFCADLQKAGFFYRFYPGKNFLKKASVILQIPEPVPGRRRRPVCIFSAARTRNRIRRTRPGSRCGIPEPARFRSAPRTPRLPDRR